MHWLIQNFFLVRSLTSFFFKFREEEEIRYIGIFLLKMTSLILSISDILQCRISCWRPVSEGVTASLPCPAEFRGIAYDTSSQ